jgi:ABC-type transport system involved in cytochrome bd biosynthesis fused ATPase/permease subunit
MMAEVVLQENLLFNRSVRENIAIADPAAPLELVKQLVLKPGCLWSQLPSRQSNHRALVMCSELLLRKSSLVTF